MPLFTKGYVPLNRQALLGIIADKNLIEGEKLLFIELLFLVWPYDLTMIIEDGNRKEMITCRKGEFFCNFNDLMSVVSTTRKQTLLERLNKLQKLDYIYYKPRKNQYRQEIIVGIINYDYYLGSAITESVTALKESSAITESVTAPPIAITESDTALSSAITESVTAPPIVKTESVLAHSTKYSNNNKKQISNNNKEYIIKNKQQQRNVVVEIQKLFKKKTKSKIPDHVCENLITRFGYERVIQNIKRLRFDKVSNPPGYLISSLEENWELPVSEEERIENERKIREEEDRRREEEFKTAQQEALPPEQAVEKIGVVMRMLRGIGIGK